MTSIVPSDKLVKIVSFKGKLYDKLSQILYFLEAIYFISSLFWSSCPVFACILLRKLRKDASSTWARN